MKDIAVGIDFGTTNSLSRNRVILEGTSYLLYPFWTQDADPTLLLFGFQLQQCCWLRGEKQPR